MIVKTQSLLGIMDIFLVFLDLYVRVAKWFKVFQYNQNVVRSNPTGCSTKFTKESCHEVHSNVFVDN